jgi:hypothetical protein
MQNLAAFFYSTFSLAPLLEFLHNSHMQRGNVTLKCARIHIRKAHTQYNISYGSLISPIHHMKLYKETEWKFSK